MRKPAVFLDRDGTINVEKHYLHKVQDWEWISGAIEAIRRFNNAGYLVIVASNQAGIARGFYSAHDVDALHAEVTRMLAAQGAHIDAYYYCPHHPDFGSPRHCDCRKPLPGLLLRAAHDHGVDLARSWMVGDKKSDVDAGHAAGVRSILVGTGYGTSEYATLTTPAPFAPDLAAAAEIILLS